MNAETVKWRFLDTGKGQRILVYENIAKKEVGEGGLSAITGKAVGDIERENENDKWLVIKPIKVFLEKEVFDEIAEDEYLIDGTFNSQCKETCSINMEISRDIAYRLVFLVEDGTVLRISEVVYYTLD